MAAVAVSVDEGPESLVDGTLAAIGEWLGSAPIHELGDRLVEVRGWETRLTAIFTREAGRFAQEGGHLAEGATSLEGWLRTRCGLSAGGAGARAEVARQLPVLPEADRLFGDGILSLDSAQVLARTVSEVGSDAARIAEPDLVAAAMSLDPTQLRAESRSLRFRADIEGARRAYERLHDRRRLSISQGIDGGFSVEGLLDPEGGATLRAAIGALCAPLSGETRTPWQRRADALVELAHRQLQKGDLPSAHGQRPHVLMITTREGSEILGAGPIPAATAERISCDAAVTDVVVDSGGELLDVGRTRRTAPAPMRRALVARDRGCVFPGCDRPPEWTDAHHVAHWARDRGPTRTRNLKLLCRVHHRFVHEGGWTLEQGTDGNVVAMPP